MNLPEFEDKSLSVLRRKFLIAIPVSAATGYFAGSLLGSQLVKKWQIRSLKFFGFVSFPVSGIMLISHFNRSEIFRIGNSMMGEINEMRIKETGPFTDPLICQKWDEQQARVRQSTRGATVEDGEVDYRKLIEDSVGRK